MPAFPPGNCMAESKNCPVKSPVKFEIKGIDDLRVVKPIGGGDNKRKRWKDKKGCIYEWDRLHGRCEKYNKNGKHLGEFDPETGKQTKPANKTRSIKTK